MFIYPPQKSHPYVYLCTHRVTGEFYIGSRCANKEPAELDFPKYRTSSSSVKPKFEEFDWIIIAEFFDNESAYKFEQKMIFEHYKDPLILNRCCHYGKRDFRQIGPRSDDTRKKISNANKGKILSDETRKKISDSHKGRPKSLEHRLKLSESGKNISDETRKKMADAKKGNRLSDKHRQSISQANKGHFTTKETCQKISRAKKGCKMSEESKAKLRKPKSKVTCPHCLLTGGSNTMKRYHFDNCKQKL